MKPLIVGINGSPVKNSQVGKMLEVTLDECKNRGAKTVLVNLSDKKILPHDGKLNPNDYKDRTNDDMPKLQQLMLDADGVIFATPTHWFHVSSHMKLFVDRLTALEHFNFLLEGKVAGFITYGPEGGALNAAMNLMMIINQMGLIQPPYAAIFDEGRNDKWIKPGLKLLAKNMILLIEMQKQYLAHWGFEQEDYRHSPIEKL